jgi:hypothetical protein
MLITQNYINISVHYYCNKSLLYFSSNFSYRDIFTLILKSLIFGSTSDFLFFKMTKSPSSQLAQAYIKNCKPVAHTSFHFILTYLPIREFSIILRKLFI